MNYSKTLIGKWGKIVAGQNAGWYVFVEHDTKETGGFFIYRCSQPSLNAEAGYDDWVQNEEGLAPFFGFAKWQIEWLEPTVDSN